MTDKEAEMLFFYYIGQVRIYKGEFYVKKNCVNHC